MPSRIATGLEYIGQCALCGISASSVQGVGHRRRIQGQILLQQLRVSRHANQLTKPDVRHVGSR